jgi:serine/threonine protein kinase/tetratricopeptide (TPR) repeat protein
VIIMGDPSNQAKSIFLAAIEDHPPDRWPAFLEEACGGDVQLRAEVEKLLRARSDLGSFHEAHGTDPVAMIDDPITERPGTVIGPYKLMEQIGEGGMGLVFVAEQQQPVRRKVALKVIKPGMDTRAVVARFEAERQALALMDHPNISQVHDGGVTPSGRPYFVMELVKGLPITQFCDDHRLATRERLELFLDVCSAVQHAHHKGIIHRDIKPTNVMVVSHDGKPVVKVIDFGVAKSIGQQLTDKTVYTQFVQLIGTPLYMSPEQAGESGLDVDTRSDIYSLGVLLYELLTGTTPFDRKRLKEASNEEIRRIIREEEPPKPSTRISTLGQAATTISTHRQCDPIRLRQLIRGELDWIVMKCLEKDRNRRYETANALAMDVQRYLNDEPVQACPPSARYRLGKFARRYRAFLRAAAAFVVLLVLAAAVSIWQAVRATLAERRALEEQKQALRERDRAEASFHMARDAVDQLFTQVSQSLDLRAKPMEKFRKGLLGRAKEFYKRFISEQFDAPGVRYDLALGHQRLGQILRELGDYSAAEESLTEAIKLLDELVRAEPDMAEYQRDLAGGYVTLGLVYSNTARWEKADAAYQQALVIQEKQATAYPEAPEHRYALAKTYSALGRAYQDADQPESVVAMCQHAQNLLSKLAQDYPNVSEYQSSLAATQMNLGQVYMGKGWHQKAESALKEAQSIYEKLVQRGPDALPEDWESLGRCRSVLGMVYRQANQAEKAENEQHQALRIFEKLAQEHPDVPEFVYDVGRCRMELGETEDTAGRPEAALEDYAKAIENLEQAMGKGYLRARSQLLDIRILRGSVLAERGDHERASEQVEALLRQRDLGSVHVYNAACFFSRASAAVDHDTKLSPPERKRVKARYADRAMDLLRQAIAKGWRRPRVIKEDRDLDPLRAREDFQELLADLEAKTKE